jgi:protein phosphatase
MNVRAFGLTDVGRRREGNEDEFRFDAGLGFFAVADGMGGHAAGEVAARLAVETMLDAVRRRAAAGSARDPLVASSSLREAIDEANRRICESITTHEEQRGMGTTIAAVLAAGDRAVVAHVGDSRVYLLREGRLLRLTSDHSWVNEQVKLGLLSDDAAQRHPMRNIVTRALGSRSDVDVEIALESIRGGDVILLCSDGLNTMLSDDEIRDLLGAHHDDPEAAARTLVAAANARGGDDNVTVIVVRVN